MTAAGGSTGSASGAPRAANERPSVDGTAQIICARWSGPANRPAVRSTTTLITVAAVASTSAGACTRRGGESRAGAVRKQRRAAGGACGAGLPSLVVQRGSATPPAVGRTHGGADPATRGTSASAHFNRAAATHSPPPHDRRRAPQSEAHRQPAAAGDPALLHRRGR